MEERKGGAMERETAAWQRGGLQSQSRACYYMGGFCFLVTIIKPRLLLNNSDMSLLNIASACQSKQL